MSSISEKWTHDMRCTSLVSIALFGVLQSASVIGAEPVIYKTVESDGTVVFTDQKAPDATVVKSSPLNVVETPDSSTTARTPDPVPALDSQNNAQSTDITASGSTNINQVKFKSLVNGQKLLNPQDPLMVEIETSPASEVSTPLMAHLLVDGKLVATSQSNNLPLSELLRGTHILQVNVVDEKGEVIAASETAEIHVTRPISKASTQ